MKKDKIIKIIDKNYKFDYEKILSWLTVIITTVIFSVVLVNKYFPVTEGWFQDYARYILKGNVIYKDFYCPVPPGYILITTLLCKMTNYSFIALRIYGILERILLISIVFVLLSRIFKEKIVAIALIVGSVIYSSTNTDLFYGYYQSALLFAILTLYFCVRMYEKFDTNNYKYAMLYGLAAGITFCMKQNTGAIFPTFIGIGYIFLTLRKNKKKAIGNILVAFLTAMCVLGLMFLILYCNGALKPFFEQVIGGTSSKGSIGTILFSFIPRMINKHSIAIFIICIVSFVIFNVNKFIKNNVLSSACCIVFYISFVIYMYLDIIRPFYGYNFQHLHSLSAIFYFMIVLSCCGCICIFLVKSYKYKNIQMDFVYYGVITLCLGFTYVLINRHRNWYTDFMTIRENRANLIYALFFFNMVYILYLMYEYIKEKKENGEKILLYIASWSLMYIHGMSYIVEDHGTLILFSLIIGDLLSIVIKFNCLKNILIGVFCIYSILTITIQKNNYTYNWWGVFTLPETYEAKYEYEDPKLYGIYGEKAQVETMNAIYNVINDNKKDGDTMYTFPHINYFNVMSDLDSPAFAKVHYFDVCSDSRASEDAKILQNHLPTFIVWQDLNDNEWATHEAIFRNGELCGQRELQKFYNEITQSGQYKLLGVYVINNSDPIYIWGKDDGRKWKVE